VAAWFYVHYYFTLFLADVFEKRFLHIDMEQMGTFGGFKQGSRVWEPPLACFLPAELDT
jgi:hypothetical protein